jgi:hypothetical protein
MKLTQIYLNATDEAAFLAACGEQGLLDDNGALIASALTPIRYDIITCPGLQKPTGETLTDDDGNEYPEMVEIDGYCAMALVESDYADDFLSDIQVEPESPVIKFAGY